MLSSDELQEIEKICEKWMFRKDIKTPDLETLYNLLKNIDFTPLVKAFTKRLETIPCKFSPSEEVSGSVCFFGGVVTSLLNYGYIQEIEGLFTFALCYMLIDHFLDDNTIDAKEKEKSMKDIYNFIYKGERNSENILINAAADRYLSLVERVPQCKPYILQLFQAELKGVAIQRRTDLSRDIYLKIAEEKGGLTAACIGSIIGLSDEVNESESMLLGSLIQTPCDDLLDVKDDKELDIYTLIRYDMDRGFLDRYLYESIKKINSLSPVYNLFKVILLTGTVLGIHDNPGCISDDLKQILEKYDAFNKETSKDSLNNWFHDKLYSYIEQNI